MTCQRLHWRLRRDDAIEQRMADKGDPPASVRVQFRFKRKYYRHAIGASGQFVDSAATPGPDLRQHVVKNRYARPMSNTRQNQIELGIIDKYEQVGWGSTQLCAQGAKHSQRVPKRRRQFKEAQPRYILDIGNRTHTRGTHLVSRDSI